VLLVGAAVARVERLQRELPVSWLPSAAALRDVRIIAPHRLGLEHLQLGVHSFQLGLGGLRVWLGRARVVATKAGLVCCRLCCFRFRFRFGSVFVSVSVSARQSRGLAAAPRPQLHIVAHSCAQYRADKSIELVTFPQTISLLSLLCPPLVSPF